MARTASTAATKTVETPAADVPVTEGETVVVPAATEDAVNFDVIQQKFAALIAGAKELQAHIKVVQKAYTKLSKTKTKRANKGAGGNATPSGFVKPAPISDALATFLGMESGTSLPRTEVTKRVNEYVKSNDLQNPSDRRTILPDEKLRALLNPGQDDTISYFNLQKFLKPHFIKPEAPAVATA